MFYEGLDFLKGLPSPEGVWERVQVIGELICHKIPISNKLFW